MCDGPWPSVAAVSHSAGPVVVARRPGWPEPWLPPEQIAGRLSHEYLEDMRKHLSAETISVAPYLLPSSAQRTVDHTTGDLCATASSFIAP